MNCTSFLRLFWGMVCVSVSLSAAAQDTARVRQLNDLAWNILQSEPDSAVNYLNQALLMARRIGDKRGEALTLNALGVALSETGEPQQALPHFNAALRIRKTLKLDLETAATYNNIGAAYEGLSDYLSAVDHYTEAMRKYEALGDSVRLARTCYNISLVHEKLTNYPEALDYAFRSLEILESSTDTATVASVHNAIGNIRLAMDQFDEALVSYQRAYTLQKRLGDDYELGFTWNNLGNAYSDIAEDFAEQQQKDSARLYSDKALAHYKNALAMREAAEDAEGMSITLVNMGRVYKDLGKLDLALRYFNRSLGISTDTENTEQTIEALNGIGDIYRRQNKLEDAFKVTERYLDLAQQTHNKRFIQFAYKDLSELYSLRGNYQKAYEYRKKFDELRYELLNESRIRDNQRRETLYGDYRKQIEIQKQQTLLQQQRTRTGWLVLGALALGLVVLLLYNRNRIKTRANRELADKNNQIEAERRRSDNLLLNILPADTAAELKATGTSRPRFYPEVTVMFTDFRGFTMMAEQVTAEDLVAALDECYKAFDAITVRHDIEKIKTIGDSYMCAAGLPTPDPNHALNTVAAAIDMFHFMDDYRRRRLAEGKIPFEMRIGIHTGPVVAGVVGDRKFSYDIWGDTVNTASRMESAGEPGRINISETTCQLVRDTYRCTHRGQIQAKNKGMIDMYFVEI